MNLLLLECKKPSLILDGTDPRAIHLKNVLRVKDGDEIDLAVQNGPHGKAKVLLKANGDIKLQISWQKDHDPDYYPISLIVAISRPQTCRKILDQATSLGVSSFSFFEADKGEPSYRKSSLWSSGEWKAKIETGVAQAFASFVPNCELHPSLELALQAEQQNANNLTRIALDNYEAEFPLQSFAESKDQNFSVCVGPERGWSERERKSLREFKYKLCHLGPRVLRVETAVVASLGILASSFWKD